VECRRPVRAVRSLSGQVVSFMGIGVVSLLAYVVIYLAIRVAVSAQVANAISLLLTTVGNIAANRRITFGIRGYAHVARDQIQGALAFGVGLALTAIALASLHAAAPRPPRIVELTVLIAANLVATLVRFILYRSWVFRPRQLPPTRRGAAGTESAIADLPHEVAG
jgi:putative flippase GtrA